MPPRLGILSYVIDGFDPQGRDVVFVPVALNYDRVLEDRFLIKADKAGERRFRPPLRTVLGGVTGYLWARMRGRMTTFGTANVSFGQPLSLRSFADSHSGETHAIGTELMARISRTIPPLPVPLVARAVLAGAVTQADITTHIEKDLAVLPRGVPKPRRSADKVAQDGIANLRRRSILSQGDVVTVSDRDRDVLSYYANSIAHHFPLPDTSE